MDTPSIVIISCLAVIGTIAIVGYLITLIPYLAGSLLLLAHVSEHESEIWDQLGKPRLIPDLQTFKSPLRYFLALLHYCRWFLRGGRNAVHPETALKCKAIKRKLLCALICFLISFACFSGIALIVFRNAERDVSIPSIAQAEPKFDPSEEPRTESLLRSIEGTEIMTVVFRETQKKTGWTCDKNTELRIPHQVKPGLFVGMGQVFMRLPSIDNDSYQFSVDRDELVVSLTKPKREYLRFKLSVLPKTK